MKIHLIAIGGAAMHNLALALHSQGHQVSGSDDEIYDPSRTRLAQAGILPTEMGWFAQRITADLDVVIVGMHARRDNPELHRATEMQLNVVSYPEFIYQAAQDKTRIVVGGSHGKTTTTSMILHVLQQLNRPADYLVGAQLEGFDRMVQISDAPVMVIEGDEYLSSPLQPIPKFHFYKPHVAILTGIAWDHINVFPTFENYVEQFKIFIETIENTGTLIYFEPDENLVKLAQPHAQRLQIQPYRAFQATLEGDSIILEHEGQRTAVEIFGEHNFANLNAARLALRAIGVADKDFWKAIQGFKGAARRLQKIVETVDFAAFSDFAHAPSKVEATTQAVKSRYPERELVACFELHTFSSLNKHFLTYYRDTLSAADRAFVFFSEHTLDMKRLPMLSKIEVAEAFHHPNLEVFTVSEALQAALQSINWQNKTLLMMSSGNFNGLNVPNFVQNLSGI